MQSAIASMLKFIEDGIDTEIVITPVLDLSSIKDDVNYLNSMISSSRVGVGEIQNGRNEGTSEGGSNINFVQNNYSPKALSRKEIYRQTKNELAWAKGVVNSI